METEKDNVRKIITLGLVFGGLALFAYVVVQIPERRAEAILVVGNWVSMALVWYFAGKPKP